MLRDILSSKQITESGIVNKFAPCTELVAKSLDKFLYTDIKIRATIRYIGTDKLILTTGPHALCCDLHFDVPELRLDDMVNVIIQLEPNPTDLISFKIIIKFICKSDSKWKKFYAKYKTFGEITRITNKWQLKDKIPHKKIPQIIRNVGLIVVGSTGPTFVAKNNFKRKFETDCKGNLYIYNVMDMTKKNISARQFINAMQLFSNYYEIDMICVLAPNLDQSGLFALSDPYVIKNILTLEKLRPYVMTVKNKSSATYAASRLFDKSRSVDQIIKLICETQLTFGQTIQSAIQAGTAELDQIISSHQNNLVDIELMQTDFFSDPNIRVDVSVALTYAAIRLLDQKLAQLNQLESDLVKSTWDLVKKSDSAEIAWLAE